MKRHPISLLTVVAAIMLMVGCNRDPHFITDRSYRNQVHADFLQRQQLAEGRAEALFSGMDTLSRREREALEFLYAYMPYSDLADYDGAFYLQQVRTAFEAQETFSWGKDIPEDVFRHFVLVYRVNNENLDSARMVMFGELKDRIKDMSMEQAALEVNHWCHEYVAYRAADGRTSAPLATMRTSLGRCGEESTFTVTAMRAVGIPARQCYTPRWAHCDDNHAWVEVWVDGEWKFLGACEPDPKLDMGWFSVPSTRCLMVHSKAFGRYHGDEEVVKETGLYSELNLLSHYAPTKHVTVTVTDAEGKPMQDITVKFKMYNYAEYYTLATYKTNADGQAGLTTGLGDLLVWATDGARFNYAKIDVRQQSDITLHLTHSQGEEYAVDMDIVPPAAGDAKVTPSDEEAKANEVRKLQEDSIRNAYMATFWQNRPRAEWGVLLNANLTEEQVVDLITRSEGNYAEVAKFLNNHTDKIEGGFSLYDYLRSYSDKDLRDVPAEMFEAQLTQYIKIPYDVYKQGLMPARISNELIRAWRQPLAEAFADIKDVDALKAWTIENVAVDDTGNYANCPISPVGVYQLRHADAHSRDIFFVAACRSLMIPAYLDNATNTIFVYRDAVWTKLTFTNETPVQPTAKLTLTYKGSDPKVPVYYPHFTIQKFENGDFVTYDFEEDPRMATFPATIAVEPGYYCLSTGRRLDDCSVLSHMEFFNVEDDGNVAREIVLRQDTMQHRVYGRLDPKTRLGETTLGEYAGNTGMILCFMGDYREPSKHLVKELQSLQKEYKQWGGRTFLVAPASAQASGWNLVNTDYVVSEPGSEIEKMVIKALALDLRGDYPLVALVNDKGEIMFFNHGYRIGLAEMMLKKASAK